MKRPASLVVVLAFILSLTGQTVATADPGVDPLATGVTWTSGFQVQNLDSFVATVVLDFYAQSGGAPTSASYEIQPNASRTFYPIGDVPGGFKGSLVINSDRNVRAISNLLASGPGNYFAATNGFQEGATSVSLPLVMCNNNGFNTFFSVQNTGPTADAHVTVQYTPGSNGASGQSETGTIRAGAAATFDQTEGSTTKNCTSLKDGSGKFIGSATITSDQPVVAVVMQMNTTSFRVLMGYNGFTTGSPTVALPLVMANNNGFYTGIQVQNVGAANTTVTIDYSAPSAGSGNPTDDSFPLAPGASKTILQSGAAPGNGSVNNWSTLGKYIGSALITNSGGQRLVAIVNQVLPSPALGTAYEGFDPASATTRISAPLIMANNGSYYTGVQVQNVSSGSVDVTLAYGPNTGGTFAPKNEVFTLAAGTSRTIIQNGAPPGNGSTVNNWGSNKYIGSATIAATGGNIVAIVNQVSGVVPGDQFATTDAFNY